MREAQVSAVFRLPPFEGKSLRIESKAPFPVDPLRHQKALIGFLIDRLVGAVWLAIAALGLGNDKLGLVTALALIGATMCAFSLSSLIESAADALRLGRRLERKVDVREKVGWLCCTLVVNTIPSPTTSTPLPSHPHSSHSPPPS